MRRLFIPLLAVILLSPLIGACTHKPARPNVREYLEEATGTSITYVKKPAAFVHDQSGLASSGRDYVYVAPLAVSRGGAGSCWLWLGIWSTVDRQARNEEASPLKLGPVQIVADNEPMELNAQAADSHPAGIQRIPYETPVPPTQEFLVQVTRSQLQRLGRARVLTLTDSPAGETARQWRGDEHAAAVLNEFADEAAMPIMDLAPVTSR